MLRAILGGKQIDDDSNIRVLYLLTLRMSLGSGRRCQPVLAVQTFFSRLFPPPEKLAKSPCAVMRGLVSQPTLSMNTLSIGFSSYMYRIQNKVCILSSCVPISEMKAAFLKPAMKCLHHSSSYFSKAAKYCVMLRTLCIKLAPYISQSSSLQRI